MDKSPQELLGKEIGEIVSENYQQCVLTRKSIVYEEELTLPSATRILLTTLTPILKNDNVTHIVGSATDITERKQLKIELKKQANYDQLTGLPNRRRFFKRLESMIVESCRNHTPFALLFLDLDGFKDINDKYGHEAGDEVLVTVGQRIQQSIRQSDTAARMGGDEYSVLIRDIEDKKLIHNIVQQIHKTLQEVMPIGSMNATLMRRLGLQSTLIMVRIVKHY